MKNKLISGQIEDKDITPHKHSSKISDALNLKDSNKFMGITYFYDKLEENKTDHLERFDQGDSTFIGISETNEGSDHVLKIQHYKKGKHQEKEELLQYSMYCEDDAIIKIYEYDALGPDVDLSDTENRGVLIYSVNDKDRETDSSVIDQDVEFLIMNQTNREQIEYVLDSYLNQILLLEDQ